MVGCRFLTCIWQPLGSWEQLVELGELQSQAQPHHVQREEQWLGVIEAGEDTGG